MAFNRDMALSGCYVILMRDEMPDRLCYAQSMLFASP